MMRLSPRVAIDKWRVTSAAKPGITSCAKANHCTMNMIDVQGRDINSTETYHLSHGRY